MSESSSPTDPVAYFLEDMSFHGRAERTQEAYERVLRRFEAFLSDPERNPFEESVDVQDATHRHCMAWVHSLRSNHASGTIATYAATLHRFYAYMAQVGAFDSNPMTLVVEEMDETIEKDPTRREIDLGTMRRFLRRVNHPLDRALVVTLLKTGLRVGELCNLDLRDVRLADHGLSGYDLSGRAALDGRGDSLYVDGEHARGEESNGEVRAESNKRKRATVVPIDDELRRVLRRWLAIRPDAPSPADPLFVSTADNWGERLTAGSVRYVVREHAADMGWYREGGGAEENVTPHYFRHFFTTHLRDRTGDRGIVKYLRGDVADDIIDTYTHNWGDRVRQTYESHIYRLLE